jgi:LysM repeat protein
MKYILLCISFIFSNSLRAQNINAYVENGNPYFNYTVAKNEDIYFIASKLAITPAELMEANSLQQTRVLTEGQQLKIPLQKSLKISCTGNKCLKILYEVQPHEGLYRIGKNFGNIKTSDLKQLNKLSSDAVSVGQQLLVGYIELNSTDGRQVVVTNGDKKPADTLKNTIAQETKTDTSRTTESPVVKTQVAGVAGLKAPDPKKASPDTTILNYNGKGFFEGQYKNGPIEKSVMAATFKSESGWNDGKFYVLTDIVAIGTIVKITNLLSAISIYAKVLGPLPALKENDAVSVRISSAGSAKLGVRNQDHFEVTIAY